MFEVKVKSSSTGGYFLKATIVLFCPLRGPNEMKAKEGKIYDLNEERSKFHICQGSWVIYGTTRKIMGNFAYDKRALVFNFSKSIVINLLKNEVLNSVWASKQLNNFYFIKCYYFFTNLQINISY